MAAATRIPVDRFLAPRHRRLLDDRAVSQQAATERGYYTEPIPPNLAAIGFGPQQRLAGLVIPLHSVRGTIGGYQLRPDEPRTVKNKLAKYETCQATAPGQPGFSMMIDVPPMCRPALGDPKIPLWITEGVFKADAAASAGLCCIGLLGVWNWRGTNERGGKTVLPDWELIALNERLVYLAFDSDLIQKHQVRGALLRLEALLESRGAKVKIILLPAGAVDPDTGKPKKVGLDDYLAAGHTTDELRALAVDRLPPDPSERSAGPYVADAKGLHMTKPDGELLPLSNFYAEITAIRRCDDGHEVVNEYEITATRGDEKRIVSTPAEKFASLSWLPKLPPRFNIHAGSTNRDRFRDATQRLSAPDLPETTIYTAPGWTLINGVWGYVNGGGVIGSADVDAQIELPGILAPFVLPAPPMGEELRDAVRKAWDLLFFGPNRLAAPLFSVTWRSIIKPSDFCIWMYGGTGKFKTARANLIMQHVGSWKAEEPYASWHSDTLAALREKLFFLKDAPGLIDDFRPSPNAIERARQMQVIDSIIRAVGNGSDRSRLMSSAMGFKLQAGRRPRCTPIITAETLPHGESTTGRILLAEVRPGDLPADELTKHQAAGDSGAFAAAAAAFIAWLAPKRDSVLASWNSEFTDLRSKARAGQHSRQPGIVADLMMGARLFFEFAVEMGAVSDDEAQMSLDRVWAGLMAASHEQAFLQRSERPEAKFIALLKSAIASGAAHLAGIDGGPPRAPLTCGWRTGLQEDEWKPQGMRVGWVDHGAGEVYLDLPAAMKAAQSMAQAGEGIAETGIVVSKRMKDAGLLLRTDLKRETLTSRKSLEGVRRDVLHLAITTLQPDEIELGEEDEHRHQQN